MKAQELLSKDACPVCGQTPCNCTHINEDLRKWFKEKWVRFGPDGKIRGDCARGDDSEGKPKCLPQSKAHALGKKGRASAAARKRREDPNPERRGPAKNVATKKKSNEGVAEGTNDPLANVLYTITVDGKDYGRVKGHDQALQMVTMFSKQLPNKKWGMYKTADQTLDVTMESGNVFMPGIENTPEYKAGFATGKLPVPQPEGSQEYANYYKGVIDKATPNLRKQSVSDATNKLQTNEEHQQCPECGGPMFPALILGEKQDACYYKVKSRYKVWPSAYASGALVQCRKKGAKNWGNKK